MNGIEKAAELIWNSDYAPEYESYEKGVGKAIFSRIKERIRGSLYVHLDKDTDIIYIRVENAAIRYDDKIAFDSDAFSKDPDYCERIATDFIKDYRNYINHRYFV